MPTFPSADKTLTDWWGHDVGYRVDGFTGALARVASTAVGEWTFTGNDTRSHFSWTYTFAATSAAGRSAVRLFVATQWAGYMRRCADACVALAET